MKPEESFLGQPVRSLQTMLRTISKMDHSCTNVIPDGIYGKKTADAVGSFQEKEGLPITGITDFMTWQKIAHKCSSQIHESLPAHGLLISLDTNQRIRLGDSDYCIPCILGVLSALADIYQSIPDPGNSKIWNHQSAESLMAFQFFSDLPPTGELDKKTWKHLVLQYTQATATHTKKSTTR